MAKKKYLRFKAKLAKNRKNEDCYYYYYSTCSRGQHCLYRHEPRALGCEEVCPYWKEDKCRDKYCNLRHMEIKKDRRSMPCFFEKQPEGCQKLHCPFLHLKSKNALVTVNPPQSEGEYKDQVRRCSPREKLEEKSTFENSSDKDHSKTKFTSLDHYQRSNQFISQDNKSKLSHTSNTKTSTITTSELTERSSALISELFKDKVQGSDQHQNSIASSAKPNLFSGLEMPALLPDSDSEDDLPPGWEERATVDGSVYYVNHTSRSTQWTHPRTGKKKKVAGELPFGWEKVVEDSGKILYVDHENHRTTYTDPRLAFAQEEKDTPLGFRQRFDGSSTALQVLHGRDLSGKTAVVTGANCGIGFETARALARHGCHVVLACRSMTRASKAIERIRSERPQASCTALILDLCSFKSVKEFANTLRGDPQFNRGIDMLVLNAGVFALPYSKTEDGLETTLQVNHLSQFFLTLLLEEMLAKAAPSRVVFVSSESHRYSTMNVNNVTEEWLNPKYAQYWSMIAYNDSKLCNVVVARELARRWVTRDICVFSCHPGNMVSSDLARYWCPYRVLFTLVRPFTKSLDQAASTQVYCATALELSDVSGLYFNNCCRCEPSKQSQDQQLAAKLWKISLHLIGAHFSSLDIPDKYRHKP